MKLKAKDLRRALVALRELAVLTKPYVEGEQRKPPLISPLPGWLGLQIAAVRVSLEALVGEAWDERERELVEKLRAAAPKPDASPAERSAALKEQLRISEEAQRQLAEFGAAEFEWQPPTKITAARLESVTLPDEYYEHLLRLGVIVIEQ